MPCFAVADLRPASALHRDTPHCPCKSEHGCAMPLLCHETSTPLCLRCALPLAIRSALPLLCQATQRCATASPLPSVPCSALPLLRPAQRLNSTPGLAIAIQLIALPQQCYTLRRLCRTTHGRAADLLCDTMQSIAMPPLSRAIQRLCRAGPRKTQLGRAMPLPRLVMLRFRRAAAELCPASLRLCCARPRQASPCLCGSAV